MRKRTVGPAVALAAVGVAVLSACGPSASSNTASGTSASSAGAGTSASSAAAPATSASSTPESKTENVTFKVNANGAIGTITTLAMQSGSAQEKQANGAPSPWSETLPVDKALFGDGVGPVGLTAQAGQGTSSITCEIDVPGKPPITNTSTGQYAVVSCNGS